MTKDREKNDMVSLNFAKSVKNLADSFTKGLFRALVIDISRGIGLKPID